MFSWVAFGLFFCGLVGAIVWVLLREDREIRFNEPHFSDFKVTQEDLDLAKKNYQKMKENA